MPGTDSPDFPAARVLADVLNSQRADIYALVPAGKALAAEFDFEETYRKASVGFGAAALPAGVDADGTIKALRAIVTGYARTGVPADLVEAAKRAEAAGQQFSRNSIPDLAQAWSQSIAAEGRESPDDIIDAIARVTVDDVNRVARDYLTDTNTVAATLVPSASAAPLAASGFGGGEQTTSAPTKAVTLPSWAEKPLAALHVPATKAAWSDMTLANGIRLIVQTDRTTPTVTLLGRVRHDAGLQAPAGKDGVDDILDELFSYGTTTHDRLAFQKALDDIAASESAGADFSLRVLSSALSRGVDLLAENELHPALPEDAFAIVKDQLAQYLQGRIASPGYKADRALRVGLLPPGDPGLRDATPASVSGIALDDVRAFYRGTFRPDLTTIVVIGDVSPAEARRTIERSFGAWTAAGPAPTLDRPRVPDNAPSAVFVPDDTQVQAEVSLAHDVGLSRRDPDYYALELGNHVLGGGFYATRLYHDLREVNGYVYTVSNSLTSTRSRSVYTVTHGCDPENVANARRLIDRDLQAMRTTDVTPGELHQAKALLLRQMLLRESSEDAVAGGLLSRADLRLPLDEPRRAAKRYATMTAGEIRAAFFTWIHPDRFVQVVRGRVNP
jgi:zinc protease